MTKFKIDKIVRGTVTGIETYGVFVSCDELYSGLIHISEISHGYVKDVNEYVKIGDIIYVEILEVDEELSRLKLSIKNIQYKKNAPSKKKAIIETGTGFKPLSEMLNTWINESVKKIKNS